MLKHIDVLLFYTMGLLSIYLCPYSKVEESFNIQAIHDLLFLPQTFDHQQFPGVVPRTSLGAAFVAFVASPAKLLLISKPQLQFVARTVLFSFVFWTVQKFRSALGRHFGKDCAVCFNVICLAQFHLIFYMSRTLPNTFALGFVCWALKCWLMNENKRMIAILSFTTIVFRADTAVFFAPLLLHLLFVRKISLLSVILTGLSASIASIIFTCCFDSFFWNRWLWPEGEVFWFNTFLNKSQEWGTLPPLWYFYSAIPRAMITTLFLLPIGLTNILPWLFNQPKPDFSILLPNLVDRQILPFFLPALLYVSLFSILPHKELRFIFNAIPILNAVAGLGLAKMYRLRRKSILPIAFGGLIVLATACGSAVMYGASYNNYPGGVAFKKLHDLQVNSSQLEIRVHIDVASAMTGVSRFGEIHDTWIYSKDESLRSADDFKQFNFLLTENPKDPSKKNFRILEAVSIYNGISFNQMKILTRPYIYIMQNKNEK